MIDCDKNVIVQLLRKLASEQASTAGIPPCDRLTGEATLARHGLL